jgi:hypothetical protein
MKKILLILIILLFAGTAFAADYYFSQSTGNDTTGDGSISTPWQTIAKINSTSFSPGDNIYLKAGDTWTIGSGESGIDIDWDGTEGNVITLTSYGTGAKPIIDASAQTGDGTRGNGATEVCIYCSYDGGYTTVDGLDLRGALNEYAMDGYNGTNGHSIVTNCDFSGSGFSTEALIRWSGDYNEITNNTFTGGSSNYNKHIEISGSDYCVISGNEVINGASGGGAIRMVHCAYGTIENNYIHGVSNGQTENWGIVFRDPYDIDSYSVIRNNLIDLSDSVLTGDDVLGINFWNSTGVDATIKIFNNTFIGNNSGSGIKVYDVEDMLIWNNIFYDFNYYVEINANVGASGVSWSNNAWESCAGGADIDDSGDVVDGGNHVTSNILLVNANPSSATDFKIQTDSSCINAGLSSGDAQLPSNDYWGTSRSSFDIGAHEYVAAATAQATFTVGGSGATKSIKTNGALSIITVNP